MHRINTSVDTERHARAAHEPIGIAARSRPQQRPRDAALVRRPVRAAGRSNRSTAADRNGSPPHR
jgi:hypothetical protein